MIKPLLKNQSQSGENHDDILAALQDRIDLFDNVLKAKTFAQPIASVNPQQNSSQNNQVKVNFSNHTSFTNQVHKHAQANGTPVKLLPGNASVKTQNPAEGLSDMKHFNRVRYFMSEEKGYWGWSFSIVAIYKSIRFYFVMLWDRTIAVKALKEFCIKVKEDFKATQRFNASQTLKNDSERSGPQSNLEVFKCVSKKLLEKMAKAANSLLKKNDEDEDSPVTIVGELFAFINRDNSKDVENQDVQSQTQADLPKYVAVNHDKPYSDALVLLDMDGCMANASDQGVKTFLETVKEQVFEKGNISIGSFSRRSILDEIVRAFRLPKSGSSFKQWQLFGTTPGNCENEFGYGTLDSENPSPPHMQFPRLDAIVDQCNKSNASNNNSTVSVSDFVVHDLFQGDLDQKKGQLRQVVPKDANYTGAVANTLRSWMTSSGGKNQKGGVLAEMQTFFADTMQYGDITFEDLCAAFETKNMSYAQQGFFTYLWCYEKIISNDSGKVSNLFTLVIERIGDNSAEGKSLKDLSPVELDLVKNAVSSLSLSELKALSIVWDPCAHNISLDEEAEVNALSDNACSVAEKIENSVIRVWLCGNFKSTKLRVLLWAFIHASDNLKTQFDNWSPNGENSNSLNVKSMQNDGALKAWFALMKSALIQSLGEMSDRKLSNKLVHNSMNPVELAGPSSNCDKVLQLLASMWEDYRKNDNKTSQSESSKLVCCVDDGYYILANTRSVMKEMIWAVPPHVKAIRFCDEKGLNDEKTEKRIDGYMQFPQEIDCTQSDKEVRQKIADHYMSGQGSGVPGLVQDLMDVIASEGKAGWDPKVNEKNTSKQRMYVLCNQDNKEKILSHDASNIIYSSSGIKTFIDAAKEKIYESHEMKTDSQLPYQIFSCS